MEAVLSLSPPVSAPGTRPRVSHQRTPLNASRTLCNVSQFSESLLFRPSRLTFGSKRRETGIRAASYGHGGNPEQPFGKITDQDLVLLQERIRVVKEKEKQLRISVSWFGKDMEASFFQRGLEDGGHAQLAGSNLSWNANPMVMSVLSMAPLYLLYIAFMVGCMTNHGSLPEIVS